MTEQKMLTRGALEGESRLFKKRGGVSQEIRSRGFVPAFRDVETGCVFISRRLDGTPAPVHLLDGLPAKWVARRSDSGRVLAVKASVQAGFVRDGRFYTREEVVQEADQGTPDKVDSSFAKVD